MNERDKEKGYLRVREQEGGERVRVRVRGWMRFMPNNCRTVVVSVCDSFWLLSHLTLNNVNELPRPNVNRLNSSGCR